MVALNTSPPPFYWFLELKRVYLLRKFLFKCEIFSNVYRNTRSIITIRNSLCVPVLLGNWAFNKFFHTSAQMGISFIKCVLEEVWKQNLKIQRGLHFLDILSIYYR